MEAKRQKKKKTEKKKLKEKMPLSGHFLAALKVILS